MNLRITQAAIAAITLSFAGIASAERAPGQTPGQAPAQAPQGAPAQQQAGPSASDFSDKEIEAFAKTQKEMSEIQNKFQKQLQGQQQDPQKSAEVQQKAQQEMGKAVQDNGLDRTTYMQMARLAQTDMEFREKVEENM
ncbi:MAG: DUF4168 domain-containing protein [Pseudomonadota bacterium]